MVKTKIKRLFRESELDLIMNKTTSQRDRSLFSFYYLFGCRRQEALNMLREDIFIKDDMLCAIITVQKRKNGEHQVCVNNDSTYAKTIIEYIKNIPVGKKIWNISGRHALRILKQILPNGYIHRFRHTRLTKLAELHATEFQLQAWAGWIDTRPAKYYVLKSSALIKELGKSVR